MSGAASALEMKMKLFSKELENVNLCRFLSVICFVRMDREVFPFQVSVV
jgi:hypothetical protein